MYITATIMRAACVEDTLNLYLKFVSEWKERFLKVAVAGIFLNEP
jgi:uncharacterized membrane protein YesL